MAIRNLEELKPAMPRHARLMGLDIGEKTIGLSVCDPGFSVASPIGTIRRTKFTQDVQELARAMKDRDVRGLIIGLPVNMDGTEGAALSVGAGIRPPDPDAPANVRPGRTGDRLLGRTAFHQRGGTHDDRMGHDPQKAG